MSDTKIDFKDSKGFWINEPYFEMTCNFILQALNAREEEFSFREIITKDLTYKVNGYDHGMLVITWRDYIKTKEEELQMASILEDAMAIVEAKGEYITTEELNSYEAAKEEQYFAFNWPNPLPTQEVGKILDALVKILKGEWESTNYAMYIDYSFFD